MYLDARPVSKYSETPGWAMPLSPQPLPPATLKRPPFFTNGPSSSPSPSLKGMEQTVPPFQSFVRRTPPTDPAKPLPPTPLIPRRRSSWTDGSTRQPSLRRSSSVYSRTTSQWGPGEEASDIPAVPSWGSIDFADHPGMFLQPIAYSLSTPQLVEKQRIEPILESRTYEPLLCTPSPTVSRATTPSPVRAPRPSVLLPPPPPEVAFSAAPKKYLRNISLGRAKEALHAPGAIHLLPEELRAQHPLPIARSKSHEPIRKASVDIFQGGSPLESPQVATLVDSQGRDRLLHSPVGSFPGTPVTKDGLPPWTPLTEHKLSNATSTPMTNYTLPPWTPVQIKEADSSFKVGTGPVKTMVPLAAQPRSESRDKAAQSLGLTDMDGPRGRTMQRGPRNMAYDHYMPAAFRKPSGQSDLSMEGETDAEAIAKEYHSLLTEQYRQASTSPGYDSATSDDSVRDRLRMVPKPLFNAKPPPTPYHPQGGLFDLEIFGHKRVQSDETTRSRSSGGTRFPSIFDRCSHRSRSTSGSIPISPPSMFDTGEHDVRDEAPRESLQSDSRPIRRRRASDEGHTNSTYYPHVMSRRKLKKNAQAKPSNPGPPPRLATDTIAQRVALSDYERDASPWGGAGSGGRDWDARSTTASISSDRSPGRPLHQRVFRTAVHYADKLTRPAESRERRVRETSISPTRAIASATSPHLLPSPVSDRLIPPTGLHLGWSEQAKSSFDAARASVQTRRHAGQPGVVHLITPARPLDETRVGLMGAEEEEAPARKGSIFGNVLESWREGKRDRRREELKKMIRVVTPVEAGWEDGGGRRPSGIQRRLSAFAWA